jgi:uncharacterized protein YicC (UPF0701 family)
MTTSSPTAASGSGARLQDHLRELHAEWLQEVHDTLNPALRPEVGSWVRWCAVQHVEQKFYPRFEREREILQSLRDHLGGIMVARLWAAAELLVLLRWQLDQLAALCHRPAEFSTVTQKLRSAIEHWLHEVEAALGQVTWADLPDPVSQALYELDRQPEVHHVARS